MRENPPAVTCVWRASGISFDAVGFLVRRHELKPDLVWKSGEEDIIGKRHETSGFNVTVAEGPAVDKTVGVLRMVPWLHEAIREAERMGAASLLDFGIMMPVTSPYLEVALPIETLGTLYALKAEIVFSVYPCSTDEE
jgi:hypothetical protein